MGLPDLREAGTLAGECPRVPKAFQGGQLLLSNGDPRSVLEVSSPLTGTDPPLLPRREPG